MGTRGVLGRHAREHGGVIAVVVVTVLGVLAAGAFADAGASDIKVAPTVAEHVTAPAPTDAVVAPTTAPAPAGFFAPSGPLVPTASPTATSPTTGPGADKAPTPPAVQPLNVLPPLGDLSAVDEAIRSLCSALLTPFGLYATVFGLVGGAIPFTLPELPFSILVGPISDLCLQLEGITP